MGNVEKYTKYNDDINKARKEGRDVLPYYYSLYDAIQADIDIYEAKVLKYDTDLKERLRKEFGCSYDVAVIYNGKWYWSIKEASEKTGTPKSTLKHWCEDLKRDDCLKVRSYDYYAYKESNPELFEEEELK